METVDDEVLEARLNFIVKARADGKSFVLSFNPSRIQEA
jgi:hypothetical protein